MNLIFFNLLAILAIYYGVLPGDAKRMNYLRLKSTNCSSDPNYVTDVACQFRRIPNKYGNFTYGATLLRPVKQLTLSIKTFTKHLSYKSDEPTLVYNINMCNLQSVVLDALYKFMPFMEIMLAKLIQTCPYKGRLEIKHLVIEDFDDSFLRLAFKTGTYIFEANFINEEKISIFTIDSEMLLNGLQI